MQPELINEFILYGHNAQHNLTSEFLKVEKLKNGVSTRVIKAQVSELICQYNQDADTQNIKITNSSFSKIEFVGFPSSVNITFENCRSDQIIIHDSESKITLDNCTFKAAKISGYSNPEIMIFKCQNCGYFESFTDTPITKNIAFISDEIRAIHLTHLSCNLSIVEVNCQLGINLENNLGQDIYIKELFIQNIQSNLGIKSCKIESLNLTEIKNNYQWDFDYLEIFEFKIIKLINAGRLKLFNVKIREIRKERPYIESLLSINDPLRKFTFVNLKKPIDKILLTRRVENIEFKLEEKKVGFYLHESELGKMILVNSDLSNVEVAQVEDSDLTEIKSINTDWPAKLNEGGINLFNRDVIGDLKQRQDVYRQLKLVMANSQDRVKEVYFHRQEMETYQSYLSNKGEKYWERKNLSLSNFSNRFGDNYIRPVVIYICTAIALYFLIVTFSNLEKVYLTIVYPFKNGGHFLEFDYELFNKYFISFIEFLNPTHEVQFLDNMSFCSAFIDFLSRIWFGFLIFQIITAFRKLYRK